MKILIIAFSILFFSVNAFAVIDNHEKMRRILQFTSPDSMLIINEKWNGVEDLQQFLDRAVVWKDGEPHTTAVQIQAKEAEYLTAKANLQTKSDAEKFIYVKANREAIFLLIELIQELLANGTIASTDFTVPVRQVYQDLKTKVDLIK